MRATLTCSPVDRSISISRGGTLGDFLGEFDEFVGRVSARGDDDENLIALIARSDRASSRRENLIAVGDARAAEFLDQQRQVRRSFYQKTQAERDRRIVQSPPIISNSPPIRIVSLFPNAGGR